MSLYLQQHHIDAILAHARSVAPDECCGILVGTAAGEDIRVIEVHPADNIWPQEKTHRFELDPRTHLCVQRDARRKGLAVVGFYHSHPTGKAVPSEFDRQLAWPDHSYLIVALEEPPERRVRSWQCPEPARQFAEESIVING